MRDVAYWQYGSEIIGFFNLFNQTRMLVVRAAFEGVYSPGRELPFTELPRLGGPVRLRGYRLDTFRDNLALLATIEYRYPIHHNVAGNLFMDVGRVARDYRDLVSPRMDAWHAGFGGGFRFSIRDRLVFRVDIAYGDDVVFFFSTDPLQAFTDHHMLEL
jgi:outer membrane protein assembly factor BamA